MNIHYILDVVKTVLTDFRVLIILAFLLLYLAFVCYVEHYKKKPPRTKKKKTTQVTQEKKDEESSEKTE